jgi:DNA-binding NarL/FixJ family response regulator
MKATSVRVLVVDDFERWRRVVRMALQAKLGMQVFEEAGDGLEAVAKAQDLQPDLVVLDIGLPTLNGIDAARRIRTVSPKSKVIFLTENYSCDVAEAALQEGASGYVVKSAFAGELIPAVEAVLEGRSFLSAKLTALTIEPQMA